MSIITTMRRNKCLWFSRASSGMPDSYGRMVFAVPVEIKCRRVVKDAAAVNRRDSAQNIQDSPKQTSESYLYPDRVLAVGDVVWFGNAKTPMADWIAAGLAVDGSVDPLSVQGAVEIKTFMQMPNLRNTEILFKATL